MAAFMRAHSIASFDELLRRSTEDIEWFWEAVFRDLDIRFSTPYKRILETAAGDPWARWCIGGRMNIVQNCIEKWIGTAVEQRIAIRWEGEEGSVRVLSYGDLHREVLHAAATLRRLGIRKGDVVGIFLPMMPETVIALFAIAKVGAISLPLFSGYGPDAVASRLSFAGAKLLFTADGFYRRGQFVAMKQVADQAAQSSPTLETVIVVRRTGSPVPWTTGRDIWWSRPPAAAEQIPSPNTPVDLHSISSTESQLDLTTEDTEAEDTLMLIFTSGTSGHPKAAVHTHCGFPLKAAQDMAHCLDVRADDAVYWITDMGWMMGPWLVFGTTLLGATMVLYDGAPDHPAPDRIWTLVERHRASVLGISPTLVRSLMQHGDEPVRSHNLASLRILGSTGEPWNPDPWMWLFRTVGGGRLPILNYSGGTEISGAILSGNLLTPLKPTAFSAPVPGIAADVIDEYGRSVRGQVGELVIRRPWIGMTRGFWKEPERYLETYWSRFPGLWTHGDWAAVDSDGLWYILGRSDDTIKVAGKRLGPAEVESILVEHEAVVEAACVGVPDPMKGEAMVCFCVLCQGNAGDTALQEELKESVAVKLGKPLKPKRVVFVSELPKTRNAKLMRRVVRAVYLGQTPGDISSLENPTAIEAVRRATVSR